MNILINNTQHSPAQDQILHVFLTSLLMMQVLETKYNHTHTLTYTVFELLLCIVGLNVRSAERKKKKKKTEKTLIPRLSCQSNTPTRTAL